jgi:hypothetical protein
MSKETNELIPRSIFNPSINRQVLDQNKCPWDDLDFDRLKMCILRDGTSPATLAKYLPWRSRKNIERKVKSDEVKSFISQWKVDKGKDAQAQFDQSLREKKRKLENGNDKFIGSDEDDDDNDDSYEEPSYNMRMETRNSPVNARVASSENMNRFLQRPRVEVTPECYFICFRHSLATELRWFAIDINNGYFECEVVDPAWYGNEWERHPACRTANFVNSSKSSHSHVIPYRAPEDADLD